MRLMGINIRIGKKAGRGRPFSERWPGYVQPDRSLRIVIWAMVIAVSILIPVLLAIFPFRLQVTMLLLLPAMVGIILIIREPFLGACAYVLIQFLRPQEFIPALRPLRIGLLLGVVTLLSWVINLAMKKQKIFFPTFNWLFLGFLGVIGITVFTALNNRMAYDIFQMMLVFYITFVIASNTASSFSRINLLIWMLLAVHFYFAVQGIMGSGRAATSLMGDENDYALALNTMIPFAYFSFEYTENRLLKYLSLGVLITFVLGVVSSMSRGGWIGLMAVALFALLQSKRKLISLAAVAIVGIAVAAFAPQSYWGEIRTISDVSEATAQTRLNYWRAALRMYVYSPVVGIGANNGGVRMPQFVTGFRNANAQWGRTFHGTLPQVLAELGTLGMVFYLAMLAYALSYLNKIRKRDDPDGGMTYRFLGNAVMGAIIGYIVTATFLSTTYYPQLWALYTFLVMIMYYAATEEKRATKTTLSPAKNAAVGSEA